MPELKNKTILIISPQSWGKMFISKHHYAAELASRGNIVFYLNPPEEKEKKISSEILIFPSEKYTNLFLIYHRLNFPYNIKFHFIQLFHWLMKTHIKRVLKKINRPVDIVWSFDLGNLYPFKYFPQSCKKIFHPVDEPLNKAAVNAAQGSDIIFAVTREITEKYQHLPAPKFVINHGISEDFLNACTDYKRGETIKVGFSGNLTRNDIDRGCLKEIITANPAVYFHLWGSYEMKDSNISGSNDDETRQFILFLKSQKNIVLHGVVNPADLAKAFAEMDIFLICYDVQRDQSKGTNYHKVMEYISTGRVIVSNNITAYANEPGLVKMIKERDSNKTLPALFSEVINNLQEYNSPVLQEKRIAFARDNTYKKQIERIEEKLVGLK